MTCSIKEMELHSRKRSNNLILANILQKNRVRKKIPLKIE
jgi:hypothetical protein